MMQDTNQDTDEELANALEPWDGIWTVPKPDDYIRGLYRLHQIEARELLQDGLGKLNNWEAKFLQIVAYQGEALTSLQAYWLRRIAREHNSEWAA